MIVRNWKKYYSYEEALEISKKNTLIHAKKIYAETKKNRIKKEKEILENINKEINYDFNFSNIKQINYV